MRAGWVRAAGWFMPMFIVDRVFPGLTEEVLAEAQRCLRDAVGRVAGHDGGVRYLRSTVIPDQERWLDLFEAGSADDVRHINDIAQVPFRWIGQALENPAPGLSR